MKRIHFGNYYGFRVRGTEPATPFVIGDHAVWLPSHLVVAHAVWLTAQVEVGGMFGSVQNYDGTGMTAGLHQEIAVYPKGITKQGPLCRSVYDVLRMAPGSGLARLMASEAGWKSSPDGIRHRTGLCQLVPPRELRDVMSGTGGREIVAQGSLEWDRLCRWINAWHELYSDPDTFKVQVQHAVDRVVKRSKLINFLPSRVLTPEQGLVFAVYHSFDCNAPGAARRILTRNWEEIYVPRLKLVTALGSSSYGNWGARYERTRTIAKESGLWPKELFGAKGIMPRLMKA